MNRREVIHSLGLVSTHVLFPSILSGFLSRCSNSNQESYTSQFFGPEEYDAIQKTIDIILPKTTTKSASQVGVHQFLDEVFAKCLTANQQEIVHEGAKILQNGLSSSEDQITFLTEVDQKAYENDDQYAFFKTIKQYTLVGFFTSQEGETKASNYVKFPGDYKGDIKLNENTLNYGETGLRFYL